MADILEDIGAIAKNRTNTQQNFMFRGIDDVYNAINPLFKKHRVFMTGKVIERSREERPNKKGDGVNIWTLLLIEWTYHAEDGSSVTSVSQGEAMDSGDKGSNKAMSVSQKYSIIQTFAIPLEEGNPDPDNDQPKNEEELLKVLAQIPLFNDSKRLAEWANDLPDYHREERFVSAVRKKIIELKNTGL